MRLVTLKALASVGLVLASAASLAAEDSALKVAPEPTGASLSETETEAAKLENAPSETESDGLREPEQFELPALQRPPQQQPNQQQPKQQPKQQQPPQQQAQQQAQQEAEQQPENEGEEQLLLAALKFETLFKHMTEMQKKFFQAVLPDSWAVPKFVPSMNTDLEQVHSFLRQVSESTGAPSVPAALVELSHAEKLPKLYPRLPPAFRHLLSSATSILSEIQDGMNNVLVTLLPTLNSEDLDVVSRLFRIPTELEFPVSPDGLSLFLPVVVRNVAGVAMPLSEEGGALDISANVADILVPVVNHEGQILFADAPSVFNGIVLPQTLPLKPLALFSAFEVEDVSTLWSAVKGPMLSKLSLLGSDSPALFGPVMALASLPRVALSLNGESQQPAASGNQLSKIVGDFSSQLRRGLRTFQDLAIEEGLPQSTQVLLRQPLEEFLNLQFLNFSIPIVGVARDLEPGVFTPLRSLSLCTSSDCPLESSLPSFPEFLVSPETAISKLQERVQSLAMELQAAVLELQQKINAALPEGIPAATDAHGISLEEALNAALSLTGTLQAAVGVAGDRVHKLLGIEETAAAADAAAAAATKTFLEALERPTGIYSSLSGRKQQQQQQHQQGAHDDEPGLLAPRRKLQGGLISLPPLSRALDLSRLELPGQGSLEQLLSLRQLTSAVENFVLVEGSPLLSGLAPSTAGKSLGALFRENSLPESLLQQPLASVLTDSSSLPSSLLNLNLGQFLSLSSALDNIFSAPLTHLPNLSNLSLNPAALLSLTPGVQIPERLFSNPSPTNTTHPAAAGNGLFF